MSGNGKDPMTGHFLPGNQINLGKVNGAKNPQVALKIRDMKMAEISGDSPRLIKIWNSLAEDALNGDKDARALYLAHMLGRPREAVEIKMDGNPGISVGMLAQVILVALGDNHEARSKVADAITGIAHDVDQR